MCLASAIRARSGFGRGSHAATAIADSSPAARRAAASTASEGACSAVGLHAQRVLEFNLGLAYVEPGVVRVQVCRDDI